MKRITDPKLIPYLDDRRLENVSGPLFSELLRSIISQQLSTRVAEVIWNRIFEFYGRLPTEEMILLTKEEEFRSLGVSFQKINYLYNSAEFFLEHELDDESLHHLSDDEIIDLLTQIKGIGRWTVEMILIFKLGREDVFAVDDLGIREAMKRMFHLSNMKPKELKDEMKKIAMRWAPYRSYACLALWKFYSTKN
ncbi:MAG: DNA-3-methyladenine glycosylase 2 family protein [Candidatus Caldatribacteriota bacterium]